MLAQKRVSIRLILTAIVLIIAIPVQAGTSGKIAGIVTDAVSGAPLQGATIRVDGAAIATEADSDGEFYIINLPVGVHSMSVSFLGYESVNMTEIRVLMDLTTPVELTMNASPIHMERSVTVVATRPLIQRDQTSSGSIVTRDEITNLANSRSVLEVISNMTGTVTDANGALHVRGGRQGTVTYLFDGFSVQDAFTGEMGIRIVPEALEELSLTSGGLAPEHGEALSGVVNAITREGREDFRGRIKVYDGATHEYDVTTGTYGSLSRTKNQSILFDLSGPLAYLGDRPVTFFTAVEFLRNDNYLPHNQAEWYSGVGKVVLFPMDKAKVTLNGAYYFRDQQVYQHRDVNNISYDFNLDGLGKIEDKAYLVGLKTNYSKSQNTVLSFSLNRFNTRSKRAPEHLFDLYWDQWPGYSTDTLGVYDGQIDDSNYQRSEDYSYIGFTDDDDFHPYYLERSTIYTGGQLSFLSQMDKHNQIKVGGQLRRSELSWDNRQFYNELPYGETYTAKPWFGCAYLQDKIELNDMVVNLGLRFDYHHADMEYWNNPITHDYRKQSSAKTQWSPRMGITHPVSENSVLHFNYGYLFQPPSARFLFTNLDANLESGWPLIGNPDLEAEKTIYFELGLAQMLKSDLRLSLTTYYKDIKNMTSTREVLDDDGNRFTVFTNEDYGSVKGFDLAFESFRRHLLNWSVSYSYMIARGNASTPREGYYSYITVDSLSRSPWPTSEYPLSFDQRHNLTAVVDFRVKPGENLKLMGWSLPDAWGVNLMAGYGSGMAYTKTDATGKWQGSLNGARMPYVLSFDMRFNKDFFLSKARNNFLSFFVEVENLFNRRNVVDVYSATGLPDRDGNFALNVNSPNYENEKLWYDLLAKDPQNYEHPRRIRVGMEFNF
ncbi:MAG: TonB-dependent receptor [FCB group bacterium]|nr:TonB-dependent receptor [FCB group bacterium]